MSRDLTHSVSSQFSIGRVTVSIQLLMYPTRIDRHLELMPVRLVRMSAQRTGGHRRYQSHQSPHRWSQQTLQAQTQIEIVMVKKNTATDDNTSRTVMVEQFGI